MHQGMRSYEPRFSNSSATLKLVSFTIAGKGKLASYKQYFGAEEFKNRVSLKQSALFIFILFKVPS